MQGFIQLLGCTEEGVSKLESGEDWEKLQQLSLFSTVIIHPILEMSSIE